MDKLRGAFTLGIAVIIGCANQQAAPEPQTGPPGVDLEDKASESAAESEAKGADPEAKGADPEAESETKKAQATKDVESSSPKDDTKGKTATAKKSCDGLKKKDCEVMMGCAWSSDKKCVNQ
jgi:hypothetical protein